MAEIVTATATRAPVRAGLRVALRAAFVLVTCTLGGTAAVPALAAAGALTLRYFGRAQDDRLLIVNFGSDLQLDPAPEPLLAPPDKREWQLLFWSCG